MNIKVLFSAWLGVLGLLGPLAGVARAETISLTYANFPPAVTFPSVQMERWADFFLIVRKCVV